MPLGSHGHCILKSTVSAGLRLTGENHADGGPEAGATIRERLGRLSYSADRTIRAPDHAEARHIRKPGPCRSRAYSGACAAGPAEETAGPSAGTAASDLMSMRQPVSLAASLAFWPSLPIASDSW
jgi:hypothetical protein